MQIIDEKISNLHPDIIAVLSMQILEMRKNKSLSGIERLSQT